MLTSEMITFVQESAPSWSRAKILTLINDVQNIVLCKELSQNRAIDTSTGKDYLFTTTAGTYTYNISTTNGFPFNGWKVVEVFSGYGGCNSYNGFDNGFRGATRSNGYNTQSNPTGIVFCQKSEAMSTTSVATITFQDDPAGNKFYVRYYKLPTQLTSESIVITIPMRYHLDVVEAVVGQVEISQSRNGMSTRWDKFEARSLPKIWSELNKGSGYLDASFTVTPIGY
jgi:hypothetical protein